MKKFLLFLLGIICLLPFTVKADSDLCEMDDKGNYCSFSTRSMSYSTGNASYYTVNNITLRTYWVSGLNSPVFCIDYTQQAPGYVNKARRIVPSGGDFDMGLSVIYKMYLIEGATTQALIAANDAMRIFTYWSGNHWGNYNYTYTNNGLLSKWGNNFINYYYGSDYYYKYTLDQRFFCAANRAVGYSSGSWSSCNKALNGYDIDLLKLNNFKFNVVEDTKNPRQTNNHDGFSQTITLKMEGEGYENMKKITDKYSKLKEMSNINVTSCSLDADSSKKGFTCQVDSNAKDLLAGSVKIIIKNKREIVSDTNAKVTLHYSYHVPFDAANLTMVRYSYKYGTQRFIVVDKDKTFNTTLDLKLTFEPDECQIIDSKYYVPGNPKPVSKMEYMKKCSPCYVDTKSNPHVYYSKGETPTLDEFLRKDGDYKCCTYIDEKGKEQSILPVFTTDEEKQKYNDICLVEDKNCKHIDDKYYDIEGNPTTQEEWKEQCSCAVDKKANPFRFYYYNDAYTSFGTFLKEHGNENGKCCENDDVKALANNINYKDDYNKYCRENPCRIEKSGSYWYYDTKVNKLEDFLAKNGSYNCCYDQGVKDFLTSSSASSYEKSTYNKVCAPPQGYCEYNPTTQTYMFDNKPTTFEKFLDKTDKDGKVCCLQIKDYIDNGSLKLTSEQIDYYNTYAGPECPNIPKGPVCEPPSEQNGYKYFVDGLERTEQEYLDAGCCDVDYDSLKDDDARETYRKYCQAGDDVKMGNECGTKTKEIENKITVGQEEIIVKSCTNENYVAYNKSHVYQNPMNTTEGGTMGIMEKVDWLEKSSTYSSNLEDFYNNPAISNYLDSNYVSKAMVNKNDSNKSINALSEGNAYCMLYTSEKNDIYFPGTAIAASGRYFIFSELNRPECDTAMYPTASCFRQPYLVGEIQGVMHTNFEQWDSDYKKAIDVEKERKANYDSDPTEVNKNLWQIAQAARTKLEKYKRECEAHNDLASYWSYNINPTIDFSYKQNVYEGGTKAAELNPTVPMTVSHESEKYWPRISTKVEEISGSRKGSKNMVTYEETGFEADQTTDYSIGYKQTLYYRPERPAYADLVSGRVLSNKSTYKTEQNLPENNLLVGYVFDVQLTTYSGVYSTSFTLDKIGHNIEKSNLQKILDNYLKDNKITSFDSECRYCNTEGIFVPECKTCDEKNKLKPAYIYRTISLSDVTPNDRPNTNWSDLKGSTAKQRIESLSGANIISMLTSDSKVNKSNIKAVTLNESSNSDLKASYISNDIYDDSSKEYLEYEFNLTTDDMKIIKKLNKKNNYDHGSVVMCVGIGEYNSTSASKDENNDYCYMCNDDGKECKSSFVEAFASDTRGRKKYKYFVNKKWYYNTTWSELSKLDEVKKLEGFTDGRYPDPDNQNRFLELYSNWP